MRVEIFWIDGMHVRGTYRVTRGSCYLVWVIRKGVYTGNRALNDMRRSKAQSIMQKVPESGK